MSGSRFLYDCVCVCVCVVYFVIILLTTLCIFVYNERARQREPSAQKKTSPVCEIWHEYPPLIEHRANSAPRVRSSIAWHASRNAYYCTSRHSAHCRLLLFLFNPDIPSYRARCTVYNVYTMKHKYFVIRPSISQV